MSKRRGRNEGSIYRRKDGRWVAVIDLGFGPDGKRKRKSYYGATRAEANEKMRRGLEALHRGTSLTSSSQKFGDFLDAWLEDTIKATRAHSTYLSYKQQVRLHIKPALGKRQLTKLTPQMIQTLLRQKQAAGLSNRTVAYMHAIIRSALSQAERWGLIPQNPAKSVIPPKSVRYNYRTLSREDAMLLLAEAKQHRLSALISVALALGLRKSEALGLRWSDVDLDNGVLSVRYQIQRVDGTWTFVPPKSDSARRTLPLPPALIDQLRKHRTEQMEERLAAGPDWHDYNLVFCTQSGQPISSRNLTTAFTRMLRRAGLGHHRWHDLRHTSATFLAAQGVHPRVAMQILGHSQISLTMNIYTHVADDVQREAIDRLAGLFDSQNDSQTA